MDSGPTAEIMAKIACFGVASWLQSGTTDVATLTATSSGRGGGRRDRRLSDRREAQMDLRIMKLKFYSAILLM